MWYVVFLLIIGFNVVFNYNLTKKTGYPPFLFSLVWFIVVFFHFLCFKFNLIKIYELSFEAMFIYSIGVIMFTLGGLMVGSRIKFENVNGEHQTFAIRKKFDVFLIIITLIFLPIYIISSYQLAVEYMIFDSLFAGLRNAATQEKDVGFSKYGTNFAYVSFFIQSYQYILNKNNKLKLILSAIILLVFCVLSTGRTFFVIYLSLIFGILIVFQKLRAKYLLYGLLGVLVLFSTVGILLNNGGSSDNSFGENIYSLFENFMIYFVGSLSAFDVFIHSIYFHSYGENSFRFIYSSLDKIGLTNYNPSNLVDDYVSVPFDTNVYTIYKIYFQDFGFLFMMGVIFTMSVLHTYFYYKAIKERRVVYTFFYSVMLYPLFMSFFQEQYLSLMPTWLYLIFIIMIVKPFLKEKYLTDSRFKKL